MRIPLWGLVALLTFAGACGGDEAEDKGDNGKASGAVLKRAVSADARYGARFTFRGRSTEGGFERPISGYGQIEADEEQGRVVDSAGDLRLTFVTNSPFLLIPSEDLFTSADTLPAGTEWVKINMSSVVDAPRLEALSRIERLGPTQTVTLLSKLGPSIEPAGREPVDGVQTKRYRLRVKLGGLVDEILQGAADPSVPESAHDNDVTFVLWLDRRHLVRRARVRLQSGEQSLVLTTQVTAYARNLRVSVPRESTIEDKTDEFVEFASKRRAQREEEG